MNSTYSFYLKNRINRKFQLVLRIAHRLLTNSICISIFQNAIVLQNTTLSILLTYISFFKTQLAVRSDLILVIHNFIRLTVVELSSDNC